MPPEGERAANNRQRFKAGNCLADTPEQKRTKHGTISVIEKARPARFYASEGGREPVREWLRSLPDEDRQSIGKDLARVEFGAALKKPLVDNLGNGLWEVRTRLRRGRIARVFFALGWARMVLLHGIIKKSQRTPSRDLELARRRKRLWEAAND